VEEMNAGEVSEVEKVCAPEMELAKVMASPEFVTSPVKAGMA
jgi:hypothetical protein